jgi:hypothetical protein
MKKEFQLKRLTIGEKIGPLIRKKRAVHTKNPFTVKKPDIFAIKLKPEKNAGWLLFTR